MTITTTNRLYLRELEPTDTDAELLFQVHADPGNREFTGDRPFDDLAGAMDFIRSYDHYGRYGFGKWVICRNADNVPVGLCGLTNHEDLGIIDIGYRVLPGFRRQGYASESVAAVLSWAFESGGLEEITGRVAIGNELSEKILQNLGFTFEKADTCGHHPANWYILRRTEWLMRGTAGSIFATQKSPGK